MDGVDNPRHADDRPRSLTWRSPDLFIGDIVPFRTITYDIARFRNVNEALCAAECAGLCAQKEGCELCVRGTSRALPSHRCWQSAYRTTGSTIAVRPR